MLRDGVVGLGRVSLPGIIFRGAAYRFFFLHDGIDRKFTSGLHDDPSSLVGDILRRESSVYVNVGELKELILPVLGNLPLSIQGSGV